MRPARTHTFHRLWAEHKYRVMAQSYKRYLHCGQLVSAQPPRARAFLRQLAEHLDDPMVERNNALLHAYGHLKRKLPEDEKETLIAAIADNVPEALDQLYAGVVALDDQYLLGSRLFRDRHGFYKWLEPAGTLVIAFGPSEVVLSSDRLVERVAAVVRTENFDLGALRELASLDTHAGPGIDLATWQSWPTSLRMVLLHHLAVVVLSRRVIGHPRWPWAHLFEVLAGTHHPEPTVVAPGEAVLLAVERFWDDNPATVGELPSPAQLAGVWGESIGGHHFATPSIDLAIRTIGELFALGDKALVADIDAEPLEPEPEEAAADPYADPDE